MFIKVGAMFSSFSFTELVVGCGIILYVIFSGAASLILHRVTVMPYLRQRDVRVSRPIWTLSARLGFIGLWCSLFYCVLFILVRLFVCVTAQFSKNTGLNDGLVPHPGVLNLFSCTIKDYLEVYTGGSRFV
jgi:hypothetical protein